MNDVNVHEVTTKLKGSSRLILLCYTFRELAKLTKNSEICFYKSTSWVKIPILRSSSHLPPIFTATASPPAPVTKLHLCHQLSPLPLPLSFHSWPNHFKYWRYIYVWSIQYSHISICQLYFISFIYFDH